MKLIAVVRGVALALLFVIAGAGATSAKPAENLAHLDEFHCQYCNMVSENSHKFTNVDCSEAGNGCKDCHVFNACHLDTQTGTCDGNHNPCAESFATAVAAVSAALEEGDHGTLTAAVTGNARVHWNAVRQVVQVIDCNGRVGYQASLMPGIAQRVEESLRTAQ